MNNQKKGWFSKRLVLLHFMEWGDFTPYDFFPFSQNLHFHKKHFSSVEPRNYHWIEAGYGIAFIKSIILNFEIVAIFFTMNW